MAKTLPRNFLWGGTVAVSQVERTYNGDGRGLVVTDVTTGGSINALRYMTYTDKDDEPGKAPTMEHNSKIPEGIEYVVLDTEHYPNRVAVDSYRRYKEDIKLFAEIGYSVFRLSISWARIFPDGNNKEPNQAGLDFYRSTFEECCKHNIEPLVSIWCFDTSFVLEKKYGGWKNRRLIDFYVRYREAIFTEYKDLVEYWLTFNEINNTTAFPDMFGIKVSDADYQDGYQILHHQFAVSTKTAQLGHAINPDFIIGNIICRIIFYPGARDPADILANEHKQGPDVYYCDDVQTRGKYGTCARRLWEKYNVGLGITAEDLEDLKCGIVDMHTLSYYISNNATTHTGVEEVAGNFSTGAKNPYLTYSDWGWAHDPVRPQYYLGRIYDHYEIPLMVAEDGLDTFDTVKDDGSIHDDYRIDYYCAHISTMADIIGSGADLVGYATWGCIDIVSAGTDEIRKRCGFIYIDTDDAGNGTLNRIPRDSFYRYKDALATNGQKAIGGAIQNHQLT